jgi:DNA-binding MarR family transcriptional regulator
MRKPAAESTARDERAAFRSLARVTFRMHGALLAAGDALSVDLGLTSGLWPVLATLAGRPMTVAQTARRLGLRRQSVRRSVQVLTERGLLQPVANPDHCRAAHLVLTEEGERTVAELDRREAKWWAECEAAAPRAVADLARALEVFERLLPQVEAVAESTARSTRVRATPGSRPKEGKQS